MTSTTDHVTTPARRAHGRGPDAAVPRPAAPAGPLRDWLASTAAELLRLRRWSAVWLTAGAWLTLEFLFGYLFNYLSFRTGDNSFSNDGAATSSLLAEVLPGNIPTVLIQGAPMFGGALMMVLGALVAGNGYGWGTWKTVFTQGPSRTSAVLGSITALAALVAALVLATLALCVATSTVIAGLESQTVVWPAGSDLLRSLGAGYLILLMWALAGFLLGTIARSPSLSVGFGVLWALVVENLLRGVGSLLGPVESFTHVLPGTAAGSLVGALSGETGDGTPGVLTVLSGSQAVWTLLVYAAAMPLCALLVVRRRDVG